METILVTGSNRGLGLEWVRQYAHAGWQVYATCRDPENAMDLKQLAYQYPNIIIHKLDVTHPDQVALLAKKLIGAPIDLLINNAGVYFERWGQDSIGHFNYRDWEETYRVNTLGAVRVTEALLKNLSLSTQKLVVVTTSIMGSINHIEFPHDYAYRSSKAALNAIMKGLAMELKNKGVGVLLLHPGGVRTRMGGANAPLSTKESVQFMSRVVSKFDLSKSGKFYGYNGNQLPW